MLYAANSSSVQIVCFMIIFYSNFRIEWEVYDVHSGVYEVFWRIFDNFTKTEIVHGKSHESIQGDTQVLKRKIV